MFRFGFKLVISLTMDKFVKRTKRKSGDDTNTSRSSSTSTSIVDIDQESVSQSLSAQPEECPEPKKKNIAVSSDDIDTFGSRPSLGITGSDVNFASTSSKSASNIPVVTKKEIRHQSWKGDYSK